MFGGQEHRRVVFTVEPSSKPVTQQRAISVAPVRVGSLLRSIQKDPMAIPRGEAEGGEEVVFCPSLGTHDGALHADVFMVRFQRV